MLDSSTDGPATFALSRVAEGSYLAHAVTDDLSMCLALCLAMAA